MTYLLIVIYLAISAGLCSLGFSGRTLSLGAGATADDRRYWKDKQTRIIRICLKWQNFGAFRLGVLCRRQPYKLLRTKNHPKFCAFKVEEFLGRGFLDLQGTKRS